MTAFQRLQQAYFEWRWNNQVPDMECIIIKVTPEFRADVLSSDVRGAWWQEEGGRNPKERMFGCPFEVVRQGEIDGEYEFVRPDHKEGGYTPEFLIDPDYHGGA